MGYADGFYYGQGRIICDTSTFSVGDTIRVRSMTDSSKVWNQQVATVGTALVFTVPPYDLYKICTVQDIGGVATEIGGVYKTVDYGQTLFIDNVLDLHTLQGIQGVINAHNENYVLNIGDEVTIKINDGGTPKDWVMQIGLIDSTNHIIKMVSKILYGLSANNYDYSSSALRTAIQGFYSNIDDNDKRYIKETRRQCTYSTYDDYVWTVGVQEVQGSSGVPTQTQYPLFVSQENRVRTLNGTASAWWTSDYSGSGQNQWYVTANGVVGTRAWTDVLGILPCFELRADS